MKRKLRNLDNSINHGILFQPGYYQYFSFGDANYAGDPLDWRSNSGSIVFLDSSPISWSTKKQPNVSCSSTEAEYHALA